MQNKYSISSVWVAVPVYRKWSLFHVYRKWFAPIWRPIKMRSRDWKGSIAIVTDFAPENKQKKPLIAPTATKNLIHKIPSSFAPRCLLQGVWGLFTDRNWNITDQSWSFTRIFNLASNPWTTINDQPLNQSVNGSIVNWNSNATKFYQSDEMLQIHNQKSRVKSWALTPITRLKWQWTIQINQYKLG